MTILQLGMDQWAARNESSAAFVSPFLQRFAVALYQGGLRAGRRLELRRLYKEQAFEGNLVLRRRSVAGIVVASRGRL